MSVPSTSTAPSDGFVEAEDQALDGGLAGADAAEDADPLARLDLERDAVQRRGLRGRILEGDVAELDRAFDPRAADEDLAARPLDRAAPSAG
jgi:hypothetical protein